MEGLGRKIDTRTKEEDEKEGRERRGEEGERDQKRLKQIKPETEMLKWRGRRERESKRDPKKKRGREWRHRTGRKER